MIIDTQNGWVESLVLEEELFDVSATVGDPQVPRRPRHTPVLSKKKLASMGINLGKKISDSGKSAS